MLERLFRGESEGFYVDVGAWDPRRQSVTKHFYDKGWRVRQDRACMIRQKSEIEALRERLAVAEHLNAELRAQLEKSEGDRADLRAKLEKSERDSAEAQSEIERLDAERLYRSMSAGATSALGPRFGTSERRQRDRRRRDYRRHL